MAKSRTRKSAKRAGKSPAKARPARKSVKRGKPVSAKSGAKRKVASTKKKPSATRKPKAGTVARSPATPVAKSVVKPAAKPAPKPGATRVMARRVPSYIARPRGVDDWNAGASVDLPRQPAPAAHTPTRKPPKPRAPKPKAISHEQAVANLKALLEAKKRKEREAGAGWRSQDG